MSINQSEIQADDLESMLSSLDSIEQGKPSPDLDSTLALLDSQSLADEDTPEVLHQEVPSNPPSPVWEKLAPSRRPPIENACVTCPNSVWYTSPAEVKVYCRVMYLHSWTTKENNNITDCDGIYLGQEE